VHGSDFVADLALVLCVAALTALLARTLRQSTVVGYLLAGLVVGPYLPFPIFADPGRVDALAEFGVVLVMFAVGLGFRIRKLLTVLPTAGLTGLVQVGFLMWCGTTVGQALGWSAVEATFLGACLAISSTMVVTKVFDQIEVESDLREHVLGVLIVQDVLAIVLIAAMTAVASGSGLEAAALLATLGRLGVVLLALTVGGMLVVPRLVRAVVRLRSSEILAVVAIGVCFGLALLAEQLGYSVALGAFLAGILVAESGKARPIETLVQPLRDVFAAVFFVSIGMSVDPRLAAAHLGDTLVVFGVVVAAQLGIVSLAGLVSGLGLRRSVSAGLALGQIGEFSFILATIGVRAGAVRPELAPILVSVAVLTAFTTPHLLGRSERAVALLDRLLPSRVRNLLSLYESWLERFRAGRADPERWSPVRRAIRAVAVDAFGCLLVASLAVRWLPQVARWMAEISGMPTLAARMGVAIGVMLVGLPLVLGLARNTLALARRFGESVLARYPEPTPAARLAAHTSRSMIVLVVLLAIGIPSIAVLRPLLGAGYGMALLSVAVLGLVWHLWRNAGEMETEVRSGAEVLANLLARQSAVEEPGRQELPVFPGLESARPCPVEIGSASVGRTLAELDLRARTGATVLAIRRGDRNLLLPTGSERLETGDVLALVGSGEAVARGQALLMRRVPAEVG